MKEIWKPVRNYEGLYEVSNMGRVKSLERMKWNGKGYYKIPERIMRGMNDRYGYLVVSLSKDGKRKACKIHRLVAIAFLENPNNLPVINHKDENKQNNIVSNLEFCSVAYNNTYNDKAKKAGKKISEKMINNPKRSKPIFSIDKESGEIREFPSTREASRQTGINNSNIIRCCKGKIKSAGGFYWHYAESEEVCDE